MMVRAEKIAERKLQHKCKSVIARKAHLSGRNLEGINIINRNT